MAIEGAGGGAGAGGAAAGVAAGAAGIAGAVALTKVMGGLRKVVDGLAEPFEKAGEAAEGFAKNLGAGSARIKGIAEAATSIDDLRANLQRATGEGEKYTKMTIGLQAQMEKMGVSIEEAKTAFESFYNDFSRFTLLSPDARNELAAQATAFTKLGISISETVKNFGIYMQGLGMAKGEAEKAGNELAKFALAINVAPKQMVMSFQTAMPVLAAHGKAGIKVFEGLAIQAKASGISVQKLLDIAGKFDTFESAATAAGNLNAMLGGPLLNSIDLLVASEDERIDMIRQSIEMSGRSFIAMNKFEKQSIAGALGIQDMTIAMRLFGTEQATWEEVQKNADPALVAQQNLAKAMQDGVKISEKWNSIMTRLSNTLGQAFLPIMVVMTEWITGKMSAGVGVIDRFAAAIEKTQKWWKNLNPEVKKSIKDIGELVIKGALLSIAISRVKAVADPLFDILTSKWTIILGGIGMMITHWGKMNVLWEKAKVKLKSIDKYITNLFTKHKDIWWVSQIEKVYLMLKEKIPVALNYIRAWFTLNKGPIKDFFNEWVAGPLKGLWEQFSGSTGIFEGGVGATLNRFVNGIKSALTGLKLMIVDVMVGIAEAVEGASILSPLRGMMSPERIEATKMYGKFAHAGTLAMGELGAGILGGREKITIEALIEGLALRSEWKEAERLSSPSPGMPPPDDAARQRHAEAEAAYNLFKTRWPMFPNKHTGGDLKHGEAAVLNLGENLKVTSASQSAGNDQPINIQIVLDDGFRTYIMGEAVGAINDHVRNLTLKVK